MTVQHEDKVECRIPAGHKKIRDGKIQQEQVGHRPHPTMSQNDPHHDDIPDDGHQNHGRKQQSPQELLVPRQQVRLVEDVAGYGAVEAFRVEVRVVEDRVLEVDAVDGGEVAVNVSEDLLAARSVRVEDVFLGIHVQFEDVDFFLLGVAHFRNLELVLMTNLTTRSLQHLLQV